MRLFLTLGLICACLHLHLWSEDPCDPLASLEPAHQFACLAALREPLNRSPDDPHLLGLATMAYVMLSLPTSVGPLTGDCGPFFAYAHELHQRQLKARGGRPAATIDEALPGAWLAALDGDRQAAFTELQRWPEAAEQPAVRALRTFVTRDWRTAKDHITTALEAYAVAWAQAECSVTAYPLEVDSNKIPMRVRACLITLRNDASQVIWQAVSSGNLSRNVLAEVIWMLGASTLDSTTACTHLITLGQALGIPRAELDPLDGHREELIRLMNQRIPSKLEDPSSLVAAWQVCQALISQPAGIMDGSRFRLVGLGDVARWNRDWLTWMIVWCHQYRSYGKTPNKEERARLDELGKKLAV